MSSNLKRPRSTPPKLSPASSPEHTSAAAAAAAAEPPSKARRTTPSRPTGSSTHPLLCTLPPTCSPPHPPTSLANSKELETHYATYHAHVCEDAGCGCVFPEARLLELHQTECHDPIAALRKDRGEKIFACHLAICPRVFSTPKTRRLHLIQAHGYPKEYFFAVTNKGVGGLLRKWGEGVSMVRGSWKSREQQDREDNGEATAEEEDEGVADPHGEVAHPWDDGPLVEEDEEDEDTIGHDPAEHPSVDELAASVDELAASMDALALVPTTVQFGRGAKRGAVAHRHGARDPRGSQRQAPRASREDARVVDDVERTFVDAEKRGRGRGRGRGQRGQQHAEKADGEMRATRPPIPPRGLGMGVRGGFMGRGRIAIRASAAYGGRGRGGFA